MRVWIVTTGEPMPMDEKHRLMRSGLLARVLAARQHDVVWWASTFDHSLKRHRSDRNRRVEIAPRQSVMLAHSPGYRKNVSLARVVDHRRLAASVAALMEAEVRPDVILSSFPTPDLCDVATRFGRSHGVPVAIDIRDLWPDSFLEILPRPLRWVGRLALTPMYRTTRRALSSADSVLGVTAGYVDWGLRLAGRPKGQWDRSFPIGYTSHAPALADVRRAEDFWDAHGLHANGPEFRVAFVGTMGRQFELDAVLDAARRMSTTGARVRFVLCGDGDRLEHYREVARGVGDSVLVPGWVGAAEIYSLMRRVNVGLAPYRNVLNFCDHVPNKIYEYLSAGLPIVSTLHGSLEDFLTSNNVGVTCATPTGKAIASTLEMLRSEPSRLQQLSENSRRIFDERFTADRIYGEMAEFIEKLAGARISACG